eukprot:TRINITY_DN13429_c0_g1_i1.p1 TRINITY_DN13429_c0_g1~~TRINITY_DN13429_c0_g1_i1.p1  ORF type:complete len:346 (+),score=58.49 TRINITY_DN13429_c0_g1_i1:44-1039(+)
MKVAVFSYHEYDRKSFESTSAEGVEFEWHKTPLNPSTARLAAGCDGVCAFVNDDLSSGTLEALAQGGTKIIALRCAGFNNVDLDAAQRLNITVARVPCYSPYSVAEHAMALILSLNRKIYRAIARVKESNFSLDGLLGFDLHGKTVAIIGTGKIGAVFAQICRGFGMNILLYDVYQSKELIAQGFTYTTLDRCLAEADIISLHVPLLPTTEHMINAEALGKMKQGVMLINTSRGKLVDTRAVIAALKTGKLGALGLDVYEEEDKLHFFEDNSGSVQSDDVFARLMTFPNVIVTGHQAFFTQEALSNIASATIGNLQEFAQSGKCTNVVSKS